MSDLGEVIQQAVAESGQSTPDSQPDIPSETPSTETPADTPVAAVSTEVAAPETPAEPAAPEADKEADEEAALSALERELVSKDARLSNGRISVSRHQAVLTRARNQHKAELETALAPLKEFATPEWQERKQAILYAENNPKGFFREVLLQTPAYQSVIEEYVKEQLAASTPTLPAAAERTSTPAPAPDEEMPRPDRLDPNDGSVHYSAEGIQRLLAWQQRKLESQLEARVQERLKPLEPVLKDRETQEKVQQQYDSARARVLPVLEQARASLEGFRDHEGAMREWMRQPGNERATVFQAYAAVVLPKLKGPSEAEIRAKIRQEDAARQPKPTIIPGQLPAAAAAPHDGPRDIESVIRDSIRRHAS